MAEQCRDILETAHELVTLTFEVAQDAAGTLPGKVLEFLKDKTVQGEIDKIMRERMKALLEAQKGAPGGVVRLPGPDAARLAQDVADTYRPDRSA